MDHICSPPDRLDWNTMCRPSGDHEGKSLRPPSCVKLHPLFAGHVHQINILRSRCSWTVMPNPGKDQELAIGRPRRRDRVPLVREPLHIGAVRLHGVNLRQPAAPAYPRDLRACLAIPYRRNIRALERRNALNISAGLIRRVNFRSRRSAKKRMPAWCRRQTTRAKDSCRQIWGTKPAG